MSNKASIAALDQLILKCEESMLQPFSKKTIEVEVPQEEAATIDEKLSEDDELLAEFYASQGEGE